MDFVVFHCFHFLEQQTNDEENPETRQLLLEKEKENYHDGVYKFGNHIYNK